MGPVEGEIIDLNGANVQPSKIICVHPRPWTHTHTHTEALVTHKWQSFFLLKDRQARPVFFLCEQQNVEPPMRQGCI